MIQPKNITIYDTNMDQRLKKYENMKKIRGETLTNYLFHLHTKKTCLPAVELYRQLCRRDTF